MYKCEYMCIYLYIYTYRNMYVFVCFYLCGCVMYTYLYIKYIFMYTHNYACSMYVCTWINIGLNVQSVAMNVHYGIGSNTFAPLSSSLLSHTRSFSLLLSSLMLGHKSYLCTLLSLSQCSPQKTNKRPREQCYHFMYFFINFIELMKFHLPSRTTFKHRTCTPLNTCFFTNDVRS